MLELRRASNRRPLASRSFRISGSASFTNTPAHGRPLSCALSRLPGERMACHIYVQPSHRLHRMPARYGQRLYQIRQCYIGVAGNKEGFLILPCSAVCRALVQRIIFFVFQILSLICLKNLVGGFPSSASFPRTVSRSASAM